MRPSNVGIHGLEVYFPKQSVRQEDLEIHSGVPPGKFTIGLGQQNMAFCSDLEDINSICMTAVQNLLEKYDIDPSSIGRLEVGTETLIDKSKSVKSTIMQLFAEHGNFDVEGVDNINACFGGTQALLNSVAWTESSAYDGRYALVVCGDIAIYEEGPARPTGGCAAVAMLIGPDAPLTLNPVRASYMADAYDFYKPHLHSEYPVVFGHESNVCYLSALDSCYEKFCEKRDGEFSLADADHVVFHSPYNKLVKKSGARMLLNDYVRNPNAEIFLGKPLLAELLGDKQLADTYYDRDLEKAFVELARPMYDSKVAPSTLLPRELGNSYTAAAYTGLLSLIDSWHSDSASGNDIGKNVLMFSYGSGLASTLFSLECTGDTSSIARQANLCERLSKRVFKTPEEFSEALLKREQRYNTVGYTPEGNPEEELFPGSFYLTEVDEYGRRSYARTPTEAQTVAAFTSAQSAAAALMGSSKQALHAKAQQSRMFSSSSSSKMIARALKRLRL